MRSRLIHAAGLVVALAATAVVLGVGAGDEDRLPPPKMKGSMSLEQAIAQRRSVRSFTDQSLTREELSQLCWAAQGITDQAKGRRAAPSAGALYPIELYVVTSDNVEHYVPKEHRLERHAAGNHRQALQAAAYGQNSAGQASVCFVIAAVVERTAKKYGPRAERYCFLEAGHVAQNLLLQATALSLAGVPAGAFEDDDVAKALELPPDQRVLYLVPIGHAAGH